jgi:hypothetical protein
MALFRSLQGGLGSLLSYIPGGLLKGGIGLATRLTQAGASGSEEARARAEEARVLGEADATAGQQFGSQLLGTGTGFSELLPIQNLIRPVQAVLRGVPASQADAIAPGLFNSAKRMLETGGLEGVQEGMANIAQDLIAKGIYNPDLEVGESALGDAAMGASIGAFAQGAIDLITRDKRRSIYEQLKQEERDAEDQSRREALAQQEAEKLARAQEGLGFTEALKQRQEVLRLPAPAVEVDDVPGPDPLRNPLGNFTEGDLTPEVTRELNRRRKEAGLPTLKNFSIEDLADLDAPQAQIDAFIANRLNQQGIDVGTELETQLAPRDILGFAQSQGVDTSTIGFTDFLRRTTGADNINKMSPVQRLATISALRQVPEGTGILPQGTNATRFTDQQYNKAVDSVKKTFPDTDLLGQTSVIQEIKDFSGLTNDRDAESLLQTAIQRGDLTTVSKPIFEVTKDGAVVRKYNTRKSAEEAASKLGFGASVRERTLTEIGLPGDLKSLPGGPDIRKGTFQEGTEPVGYDVRSDTGVLSTSRTLDEANKKADSYTAIRQRKADELQEQITKSQAQIDRSQSKLEEMEATGQAGTTAYAKAAAGIANNNKNLAAKIERLNKERASLLNPLTVAARGQKPVTREGYTLFDGETPVGTFPNQQAAEQAAISRYDEDMLQRIADTGDRQRGLRPKRLAQLARDELARRRGEGPQGFGVEITSRPGERFPDRDAAAQRLEQAGVFTRRAQEQINELQKKLLPALKKLGLESVGLRIVRSIQEGGADGFYAQRLITIALDAKDPVGTLRHESIHALKELGAFKPNEWKVLERRAQEEWIDRFLKDRRMADGRTLFDAYKAIYQAENGNLNGFDAYITEEAIADAFKYFNQNKAPAGLIANLMQRLKKFFDALENAFKGLGFQTADDVFTRTEAGMLQPIRAGDGAVNIGATGFGAITPTEPVQDRTGAKLPTKPVSTRPVTESVPQLPPLPQAKPGEPSMPISRRSQSKGSVSAVPMSLLTTPEALQRVGGVLSVLDKSDPNASLRALNLAAERGGLAEWEARAIAFGRAEGAPGPERYALKTVQDVIDDGINRLVNSALKAPSGFRSFDDRQIPGLGRVNTALERIEDGIVQRLHDLGVSKVRDERGRREDEEIKSEIQAYANKRFKEIREQNYNAGPEAYQPQESLGQRIYSTIRSKMGLQPQDKYQLRLRVKPSEVVSSVIQDLGLTDAEAAATSLGLQTGRGGTNAFKQQDVGGIRDIVEFLEKRHTDSGMPQLDLANEADRDTLGRLLAAEVLSAIRAGGANIQWYDKVIDQMLGMASLKYPELRTDPNAQAAFRIAVAVSSQGMNVEDNLKFGERVYEQFSQNAQRGQPRFPEIGTGESKSQMQINFRIANKMIDRFGMDTFRRFLETPFTVGELNSAGLKITGELADEQVLGSSVFGPKIGFGFYSNLSGNFEPVTMDMWFMRTIGRLMGKLRSFDPAKYAQQVQRFRGSFGATGDNGIYANEFSPEEINAAIVDEQAMIDLARKVKSKHEKDFKKNRDLYDSDQRVKTDFVKASETIINSLDNPKDAPASGTERRLLRDVVRRMRDQIANATGQDIPPASLQAIAWYPEQELYKALGAKLRVTSQNYANAMRKLLEGEGFDGERISQSAKFRSRRPRRADAGQVGAGTKPTRGQLGRTLSPEERQSFLESGRQDVFFEREIESPKAKTIIFEVAPSPNDAKATSRWNQLSPDQKTRISKDVVDRILPQAMESLGIQGYVANQIGSYKDDTNPSFGLFIKKGNADQVLQLTKMIGYALSQKEMVLASPKETKGLFKNGAVRIPVGDINIQEVNSIYQRLRGIRVNGKPILDGQTTVHGNMVVMNFSGLPIEEFAQKIHEQLQGDYNVTIDDVYSNLIEEKEYNYGDPKSDPRGDRGVLRERSRTLRSEASKLLNQRIGQAERGRFSLRPTEPAGGPSTGGGLVLGKSKQPNAASYTGIHYGKERVNSLAGGFYGTGIKGSEAKRLRESQDPRIKRRVYFYIPDTDLGGRMPKPEGGLGQHVYRQSFDNILPPGEEMTRLYNEAGRDSNDFESAVIDAGYDGYAIPSMGMMVVMNHNVPVNYLGDRDDVKGTVSVDGQLFSLRATDTPEFKQWFGDSQITQDGEPKVMYHGTARDITEFRPKQANAIFVTENPKFAEGFTGTSETFMAKELFDTASPDQRNEWIREAVRRSVADGSINRATANNIESNLRSGEPVTYQTIPVEVEVDAIDVLLENLPSKANIMPLYVRAESPFDYQKEEDVQGVIDYLEENKTPQELFEAFNRNVDILDDLRMEIASGRWISIENPIVQEAIRANRHDGFYVREGGVKNLAVYDSSQVKSAIGNIGSFSSNSKDIRFSLALGALDPTTALIPDRGGNARGNLGMMPEQFDGKPIRLLIGEQDPYVLHKGYGANHILAVIMDNPRRAPAGSAELLDRVVSSVQDSSQKYTRIYETVTKTGALRQVLYDGKNVVFLSPERDHYSVITSYAMPNPDQQFGKPVWQGRAVSILPEEVRGLQVESKLGRVAIKQAEVKTKKVYSPAEIARLAEEMPLAAFVEPVKKGTLSLKKKPEGKLSLPGTDLGKTRYSLRSTTPPPEKIRKFFDQEERLDISPEVAEIREAWIGGVADAGLNNAAYFLHDVSGGRDHTKSVQKMAREMLGNRIKAFRLMSTEELENIRAGDLDYYASFTLDPNTALNFANFVKNRRIAPRDLVVVEADLNPGDIHMLGSPGETEVVADMSRLGGDLRKIQEFAKPVRFSIREGIDPTIVGSIERTTTTRQEQGFGDRMAEAISPTAFEKFRIGFINRYESIERLTRAIGKQFGDKELLADTSAISAALMSDRASGVAAEAFKRGIPVYDKGYTFVDNKDGSVKGLMEILVPLAKTGDPFTYRAFQFYAAAKRGKRLDKEGREQVFTKKEQLEAEALKNHFMAMDIDFDSILNEYQKFNSGLVQYMVDTGVISKEMGAKWTENWDYIPFYRQLEGESLLKVRTCSSRSLALQCPKSLRVVAHLWQTSLKRWFGIPVPPSKPV